MSLRASPQTGDRDCRVSEGKSSTDQIKYLGCHLAPLPRNDSVVTLHRVNHPHCYPKRAHERPQAPCKRATDQREALSESQRAEGSQSYCVPQILRLRRWRGSAQNDSEVTPYRLTTRTVILSERSESKDLSVRSTLFSCFFLAAAISI